MYQSKVILFFVMWNGNNSAKAITCTVILCDID